MDTYNMLILFLIILLSLMLLYVALSIRRPVISDSNTQIQIPCDVPYQQLPEVSESDRFAPCKNYFGSTYAYRFYDNQNDITIAAIEKQFTFPAQNICAMFCDELIFPNTCVSNNPKYTSCMELIDPVGCTDSARPVARRELVYLYAIGRGRVSCYN